MYVIVLINPENGWDNVVGVFVDTPENRKNAAALAERTNYCVKIDSLELEIDSDNYI